MTTKCICSCSSMVFLASAASPCFRAICSATSSAVCPSYTTHFSTTSSFILTSASKTGTFPAEEGVARPQHRGWMSASRDFLLARSTARARVVPSDFASSTHSLSYRACVSEHTFLARLMRSTEVSTPLCLRSRPLVRFALDSLLRGRKMFRQRYRGTRGAKVSSDFCRSYSTSAVGLSFYFDGFITGESVRASWPIWPWRISRPASPASNGARGPCSSRCLGGRCSP